MYERLKWTAAGNETLCKVGTYYISLKASTDAYTLYIYYKSEVLLEVSLGSMSLNEAKEKAVSQFSVFLDSELLDSYLTT